MPRGPRRTPASELRYTRADRPPRQTRSGEEPGGRQVTAIEGERIVGHLSTEPQTTARGKPVTGGGEKLNLAYVAPDYQRRGVASTMLGLMRHELGYTPVNDTALTPKGKKWTAKAGVPDNPQGAVGYRWGAGMEEANAESIQSKQAHMLHAEQFDPEIVRQRASYKPKRKRKQKTGEQLTLPMDYRGA